MNSVTLDQSSSLLLSFIVSPQMRIWTVTLGGPFKFWHSALVRSQVKLCLSLCILNKHNSLSKQTVSGNGMISQGGGPDHSPAMTWRPLPFPSLAPSMIPGRSRSYEIKDRRKETKGKTSYKSEQIKYNHLFLKYPKFRRSNRSSL